MNGRVTWTEALNDMKSQPPTAPVQGHLLGLRSGLVHAEAPLHHDIAQGGTEGFTSTDGSV